MCCPYNIKRDIIKKLDTYVQDYLSEHPDATIDAICEYFGEPQAYGESAITVLSNDYILKKLRAQRRRIILCTATAVLCATLIAGLLVWTHLHYQNLTPTRFFAKSSTGIIYPEEIP